MFFKYTILVVQVASFAFCANILAIVPTGSYSHQVAFFDFWKYLSLRGHKVTVITANPQRDEALTNLTEIDVNFVYKFYADISSVAENSLTMWNFHQWVHDLSTNVSKEILSHHQVQDLIHDRNRHFDVLLLEYFYPEFLAFAEIYGCPSILVSSLEYLAKYHDEIGNPSHPALYPDLGSPFDPPLSFRERVTSTIYYLQSMFFYEYQSFPLREKLMQKVFKTTTTIGELIDNVDVALIDVNPVLQSVRAVGPTTINTGSLRDKSAKPLPQDLKDFLDGATNGFVYFSLGSNVKSKDLQAESLNAILETLGELPYKVLWKFEADEEAMPGKPDNVKLIKWAPQLGILAHSNIKLFVTQGGLQSMEETIYNEVPCVVIPFFADQDQNARLMKNKGIAEIVGRHPYIEKDKLKNAILEVINNPKYKNSVSRLNRLSLDTPMTGLEQAIWWTEYVIRNKGAKHLRNPAADLPLYQYYLLDVVGFLILVTIVTLSITFIILRKFYNLLSVRLYSRFGLVKKKLQ